MAILEVANFRGLRERSRRPRTCRSPSSGANSSPSWAGTAPARAPSSRPSRGSFPTSPGRSCIDGERAAGLGPRELARRIAYVPQIYDPVFEFPVAEVILMGRYAHQGRLGGVSAGTPRSSTRSSGRPGRPTSQTRRWPGSAAASASAFSSPGPSPRTRPSSSSTSPAPTSTSATRSRSTRSSAGSSAKKERPSWPPSTTSTWPSPTPSGSSSSRTARLEAQGSPAELITRENIRRIFDADVDVRTNPASGLPEISLVTGPAGRP